jgi:NAD(P)-dependent dehydrogenase (short-subunit alcohol dehydrogenase family)
MSRLLENQIVVITGGAGLLGIELSRSVIKNGGTVIIAEFDILRANKAKIELDSDHVFIEQLDITSLKSVKSIIANLDAKFGKIDALVNCAYPRNKNYGKHFFEVAYEDFGENVSMNLGGYFLTSQQFAKCFYGQGYGNIVNISSIYGVVAPRFEVYENTSMTMPIEYAAIKSGLLHLTKYMAKYFKGKNIKVNAISLGGLEDGQPDAFLKAYKNFCSNKGMLDASDISGTLVYLLSNLSEYVNGQNIIVDDGFTL